MKQLLIEGVNLLGYLIGYVFWIGMTLFIWKRSIEMNREVDKESANALRVPRPVGWLLTGKRDVTVVDFLGATGPILALFWFLIFAKAASFIRSKYIDLALSLWLIIMSIWIVVFFLRHLIWWFRHRKE